VLNITPCVNFGSPPASGDSIAPRRRSDGRSSLPPRVSRLANRGVMVFLSLPVNNLKRASIRRRIFAFCRMGLVFVGASLAGSLPATAAEPASKEYQVKAAFIYNFTKFVDWPGRFASPTAPIVVGVFGRNPFGEELEKIVRDRKVNGRSISVVALSSANEARRAHVVFVPDGEEDALEKQISLLVKSGVLVVGESDRFQALGGVVTFTTEDDKVRFTINMTAAEQGGLKISSQLQKLATVIRR
jgi:hypothetical protein